MPELPDVAGFKRYLDATALHQRISASKCLDERFVKGVSRRGLRQRLKGSELESSRQWGKWLFVRLSSGGYLVLHFGMTGQLHYASEGGELPRHTRLVLYFDNGCRLAIISQRMIGRASYADDVELFVEAHDLGPDATEVNRDRFLEILRRRRGALKSTLMNQSVVAGIGNVYSDEILFQARLHPRTPVNDLDAAALGRLYTTTRRVLRVAAGKGGNGRKSPRTWLLGGRGPDAPCPHCGGKLAKETVGGRTAWFCPACQPRRRGTSAV